MPPLWTGTCRSVEIITEPFMGQRFPGSRVSGWIARSSASYRFRSTWASVIFRFGILFQRQHSSLVVGLLSSSACFVIHSPDSMMLATCHLSSGRISLSGLMFPAGSVFTTVLASIHRSTGSRNAQSPGTKLNSLLVPTWSRNPAEWVKLHTLVLQLDIVWDEFQRSYAEDSRS